MKRQRNKMGIENKVPAIRFKGFSNEWIVKKLENLTEIDFSNGVFNDPQKIGRGYRLINVKDMYSGNSIDVNSLSLIEIDEKEFKKNKVEYGDIFFTRSSLVKEGIAYSNVNLSDHQELTFDGHLIRMRPCKKTTIPLFLAYLFKTSSARTQFILGGKTTTMTTIGQSDIASVEVNIPSIEEQIKIGNYFQQIDTLIALHQQKHDKLLNLKKSLLEKMFPKQGRKEPEIRFKGFSGEWKKTQFNELAEVRRGLTYKPSDIETDGVKVLRSSNIDEDKFVIKSDDVHVNKNAININLIKIGDILITSANGSSHLVGKHAVVEYLDKEAVHGGFMLVASTNMPFFLNASMSTDWYKRFLSVHVAGGNGSIGNLKASTLEKQSLYIPEPEEQVKVGGLFKQFDYLLNQYQIQLNKLNNIKQACLEKMFV